MFNIDKSTLKFLSSGCPTLFDETCGRQILNVGHEKNGISNTIFVNLGLSLVSN